MGASKVARKISNKLQPVEKFANKVAKNSPEILAKTSNVLAKSGNVLSKVGEVSGKVLTNPLVTGFVASNPEFAPVLGAGIVASKLTSKAGGYATGASKIASSAGNAIEKAQSKGDKPAMTFA